MNFTQFVRDYLATHPNLGLTFHQAMKDERVKCAFHEEKVRRCNEGIRDPPEPPRQPRPRRNRQEGDVIVNVNCGGAQPQTAQGRIPGVGPRGGPGAMPPPPPPGGLGPPGNLLPPFPVQAQPQRQPQRQPQPYRQQGPVRQGDDPVYMGRSTPADRADYVDLTNEIDQTQDLINYYNQEPRVEEPENDQRRREAPLYPRNLDQTRSQEQLALPYDQQLALPYDQLYNIQQRFDNLGQIPSQQQLLLPYDPQYSLQQRLSNVDQIPSQSLQERFQNLQIPQQYPYMPFDLPTVPTPTYTSTPLLDAPPAHQPQPVSTEELFKSIHGLPEIPDRSSILNSVQNDELQKLAIQRANELSKKVEELEAQVENAVTPEQQEHARRDYENQITQLRQESQRVQEDYRRQLAQSQQQLQQGIAEADAAIDGMRRRYNELAQANNAQYQQRLRTLQQLQQQMQTEDEQGRQRLQQQIEDHEQKMQGELQTLKVYTDAITEHTWRIIDTKNSLQRELDEYEVAGEYEGPSVFRDEEGKLRYYPGGFRNLHATKNLREVPVFTTQKQKGGVHIEPQPQLQPQPEPERDPMDVDVDDQAVYTYQSNPMRPGYVREQARRIDQRQRPEVPYEEDQDNLRRRLNDLPPQPPQRPRLFGLAPSPIAGQPTFQPRQADIGYEAPADRIDAPQQRPVNTDNLFNDIARFVRANIGTNPNINNDLSELYTEFLRQNTDGSYESMQELHKQVNRKSRQHPFNFSNRNGQFYVVGAGLKKALKKKTKK